MGAQRKGSPICPNCGAKFSHSAAMGACSKCGLPDEIAMLGPQMISRWSRKRSRDIAGTKAAAKDLRTGLKHPSTRTKRKKAHGRP